jgi:hypothetical protein
MNECDLAVNFDLIPKEIFLIFVDMNSSILRRILLGIKIFPDRQPTAGVKMNSKHQRCDYPKSCMAMDTGPVSVDAYVHQGDRSSHGLANQSKPVNHYQVLSWISPRYSMAAPIHNSFAKIFPEMGAVWMDQTKIHALSDYLGTEKRFGEYNFDLNSQTEYSQPHRLFFSMQIM